MKSEVRDMKIYITCKLDEMTGYITQLDPYDSIESAINRAKVIIKNNTYISDIEKRDDYINQFEADANKYLRIGFTINEDPLGLVRIVVKDM
jgi:hypothetical protein